MTNPIDLSTPARRTDYDESGEPPNTAQPSRAEVDRARHAQYEELLAHEEPRTSSGCRPGVDGHNYDLDKSDRVDSPVLLSQEPGDADAVDRNDVTQGTLGDCFLMSSLAALASTPEGRAFIKRSIAENHDPSGTVVSYTVTLHTKSTTWYGGTRFTERLVTVDAATYVVGHAIPRRVGGQSEVWPLVIEKAYAGFCFTNNALGRGGSARQAMETLTGNTADFVKFGLVSRLLFNPQRELAAGRMVVFETKVNAWSGKGPYGLIGGHAYQVTGTVTRGKDVYVALHNPWNQEEPALVPLGEAEQWFDGAVVGSIK